MKFTLVGILLAATCSAASGRTGGGSRGSGCDAVSRTCSTDLQCMTAPKCDSQNVIAGTAVSCALPAPVKKGETGICRRSTLEEGARCGGPLDDTFRCSFAAKCVKDAGDKFATCKPKPAIGL